MKYATLRGDTGRWLQTEDLGRKRTMKWISVTERLPNYGDIVLIFEDSHWNRGVEVAKFIKDDVFGNNKTQYSWVAPQGPMSWFGQYVSHWMPLPDSPK